jgi:DNA-binding transcriptional ArsR family regulator
MTNDSVTDGGTMDHGVMTDVAGDDRFALAVETFKLLADSTRLKIVWALLHGEHSVGDLAARVGAQPPAVSQHLAKLRAAHLVRARRDGNHVYYAAEDAHVRDLVDQALRHSDHLVGNVVPVAATPAPVPTPLRRRA